MLINQPNWPTIQQRFQAFWACELLDRPIIQVTAPRREAHPTVKVYLQEEDQWGNPPALLASILECMDATYYAGDAYPVWMPNLGPTTFSAFLGCPLHLEGYTSWQEPILDSLAGEPVWDEANPAWQATLTLTREIAAAAQGRFIVGISDIGMGGDVLCHLRGNEEFCTDLFDAPEDVARWLTWIREQWFRCYEALCAVLPAGNGTQGWMPAWSPARTYPLQNDCGAILSAASYAAHLLPDTAAFAARLDHAIFHLDGPEMTQHIDLLLDIPSLRAIQWTPGTNKPPASQCLPMLQKIQAAGKGLFLYIEPWEVEPLLENLRPEGVILHTWTTTPDEADAVVGRVEAFGR